MRKKVALIFGGRSLESDISVITAMQALSAIEGTSYIVEPIFMYGGDFYLDGVDDVAAFVSFNPSKHTKAFLQGGAFYKKTRFGIKCIFKPDVALVCCHGGEGENGTLQALLDYNGIAYTSCNMLESAICMDKVISKLLYESYDLNVMPYKCVYSCDFDEKSNTFFENIETLEYPLIIKPARQGSSIGVSVAKNRVELCEALRLSFEFDDKVLVEKLLEDACEVNCAAVKLNGKIVLSQTENPCSNGEFLSFDDKYVGGKMSAGEHKIPADIGDLNDVVKECTQKIYSALSLDGIVRVDYLCDLKNNVVYINEINSVPGSLAFYLFSKEGIAFSELLIGVIENALKKPKAHFKVQRFKSDVLKNYSRGECRGVKK